MNWGIVLFVGVALVAAGLALWAVISPRSQWKAMQSWAFRHPDANEPSDAAYLLARLAGLVVLVLLVVGAIGLWTTVVG